jgi:uncharacterized protein YciI
MVVVHVGITCAADYLARREPHRRAHVERLAALRQAGTLVAGGPAADARGADLFYRLPDAAGVRPVVEEDPYHRAGAWTAYSPRAFAEFVEPWEAPPIVLDGSRRAVLAEGPVADPELARFALIELRGRGRAAFGGLFPDGRALAAALTPDPVEAAAWLGETGLWETAALSTRTWLYVI